MSARASEQRADRLRHWLSEVSKASAAYERRWTLRALDRVDAALGKRLRAQIADFNQASVTGSLEDVEKQGAATCRGWAACARVLEVSGEPDDAYLLGRDMSTGFTIAIGSQRAAADRVAEIHGQKVVWYSADEIAALLASVEGLKRLSAIKSIWPGAEIVDLYADEPAKADFQGDDEVAA